MSEHRWRIPVGAVLVHICIGSVYAWSTFNRPIQQLFPDSAWWFSPPYTTFTTALVLLRLSAAFGPRVYQGGPGVSFSADDFSEVVYERAGTRQTSLVPAEIAVTGCFLLLQHHGVITIPITGYPGAAPTFRLMMHPDGGRLGLERLERAIDDTFDRAAGLLQQPGAVKALLLGEE